MKHRAKQIRFDEAIKRTAELEKELKDQEEKLIKRHKELNSLM